jgi:hypothetical protein
MQYRLVEGMKQNIGMMFCFITLNQPVLQPGLQLQCTGRVKIDQIVYCMNLQSSTRVLEASEDNLKIPIELSSLQC